MRRLATVMSLAIIIMTPQSLFAADAKAGRAYVQQKRELHKEKKRLVVRQHEVRDFGKLIGEMEALRMPRRLQDFAQINENIHRVMKRQHKTVVKRMNSERETAPSTNRRNVQTAQLGSFEALASDAAREHDGEDAKSPLVKRMARMNQIIKETRGLQHVIASGETDVLPRYHHLLHEFHELMRVDVNEVSTLLETRQGD